MKSRDRLFSLLRLIFILAALAAGYFYFRFDQTVWGGAGFLLIVAFAILLKRHIMLRAAIDLVKRRIEVNEEELAALQDDFTAFEDGTEFMEPAHSFSSDLDLFGRRSLFQRLNRTGTRGGKQSLAEAFRSNDMTAVQSRQDAVKELAGMSEWRESFRAFGKGFEEDANLYKRLDFWQALPKPKSFLLRKAVLWPLSALFPLVAIILGIVYGLQELDVLIWFALFNLALLGSLVKFLKSERTQVDELSKSISGYVAMIDLLENTAFKSEELQKLQKQLMHEDVAAGKVLSELRVILDRLDSMDNLVATISLNALFLYHLHALKSLYDWKEKYAQSIAGWVKTLGEADRFVSLSGFAANHASFSYPKVEEGLTFMAESIGHPFLANENRVDNSIHFDGFQFVILTGSNMAGKSTFLRTLGVSIVLAGLGVPVCAKSFQCAPMQLLSSMKPQDSLDGNQSYFQAEVTRLRAMMDRMEAGQLSFVLLDEILRGTNSVDKQNGTRAFLQKIKEFKLLGVIATHDVEIAEMTAEAPATFSNQYFESTLVDGELKFDYQLRPGVCTTPNATDLMRARGII